MYKNVLIILAIIFLRTASAQNSTDVKQVSQIAIDSATVLVLNPYALIDWSQICQYKTNLHTHTQVSDGYYMPHQAIDLYHQAGYKILSLTDHVPDWSGNNVLNINTFPWENLSGLTSVTQWSSTWEDRNPSTLNMLAVQGSEHSNGHHRGSYFTGFSDTGNDLSFAFDTISQLSGLSMLFHPGLYWSIDSIYTPYDEYSIEWYESFFRNYDILIGLEVFNQGDKQPNDRVLWDELLLRMMPERAVWGYSNDDMHAVDNLFKNYNFMLMEALDSLSLRESMKNGASYFCYEPSGSGSALAPRIDSIKIDDVNRLIHIHAQNYDSIIWISGVDSSNAFRTSKTIHTGDSFNWFNFNNAYVRAVIINDMGSTYTQPFGFAKKHTFTYTESICEGFTYTWRGIDCNLEGSYYDSLQTVYGSDSIYILHLTHKPTYELMLTDTICNGDIYLWQNHVFTTAGLFYDSLLTINGCDSILLLNLFVQTVDTSITQNGVVLTAHASNGSFIWVDCDDNYSEVTGATYTNFIAPHNGNFAVVITQSNCTDTSACFNITNVGIYENAICEDKPFYFPNPVEKYFYIVLSEEMHISLFNISGKMVYEAIYDTGEHSVFVENLSNGVYYLRFISKTSMHNERLIKL